MSVWTLTRSATDSGIIVVAAAGNGNQDLDGAAYTEYRDRGDSGAIIVGAGLPDTNHDKETFSTYGLRVNVQGWGRRVITLGYGEYANYGVDDRQTYTSRFAGTSSASPFVASAAAALQSLAEAELGYRLTPAEMRELLIDTGIPQGSGGHIGPFPNMAAAIVELGVADDCNANDIPDDCEGQTGACCPQPFGACFDTLEDCCEHQGGLFFAGSSCQPFFACPGTNGPTQGP